MEVFERRDCCEVFRGQLRVNVWIDSQIVVCYHQLVLKRKCEDFDMEWADNSCRIDEFPQKHQRDLHGDFGAYCYKGFRHSLCHGWSEGVLQFIKEECS